MISCEIREMMIPSKGDNSLKRLELQALLQAYKA